ncbi:hypothetical protein TanjilG_19811 [Lupinus angustifolius]|uniref:Mal d 1-associated protein n=1 Tax=Lupinus angustifolius TaxID=3871 RepID=A0A1J7GXU4_LUPAN|nr:PREDICTED: uncharacterized protein LOC109356502 [Lupinus angustifolius]XP_019455374.1 PREDICTED: uncharacterized protein LOC109356502 [Lupinus angustifolius]OIW05180.1 hypothetical protein TanjilG_19811 [Lupinus angustifolius]
MGWVWHDDDVEHNALSSSHDVTSEQCSTRKIVKSQCRTEEVEPGKFIRKCEKTEELLRDCVGRPAEVVQSNKEYTEEDVTNEVLKGGSITFGSSHNGALDFPGLRSDIEAMERNLFGGLSRFFETAEQMTNGFFDVVNSPHIFDAESSSPPPTRRGIPIEEYHGQEAFPKPKEKESIDTDFAAMAKDI